MLEITKMPVRLPVIFERTAPGGNRPAQNIADSHDQRLGFIRLNIGRRTFRINAGLEQGFAHVNIPQPRDMALIQQRRFDRSLPVGDNSFCRVVSFPPAGGHPG